MKTDRQPCTIEYWDADDFAREYPLLARALKVTRAVVILRTSDGDTYMLPEMFSLSVFEEARKKVQTVSKHSKDAE